MRTNYSLRTDKDNNIFFVNNTTKEEYHIGDEITIVPNMSFDNGERFFTINEFYISDQSNFNSNKFEFVYVFVENKVSIHLNDVVLLKTSFKEETMIL